MAVAWGRVAMKRVYRAYHKPEPAVPAGLGRPAVIALIAAAAVVALLSAAGAVWLVVRDTGGGARQGAQAQRDARPAAASAPPPAKVLKLRDHPLLANSALALRAAPCRLPQWQPAAAAELAFLTEATGCLNAAWKPVLEAAGLPFADAGIAVHYGADYSTACVERISSVSLCDNTIHLLYPQEDAPAGQPDPGSSLELVSGWYGEHVQALSGITAAYREARASLPEDAAQRGEFGRRHALQWQCFSGSFIAAERGLGSITAEMFDQALASTATYGDDLGEASANASPESHRRWFQRGAEAKSLADCNTWAAPSADVT